MKFPPKPYSHRHDGCFRSQVLFEDTLIGSVSNSMIDVILGWLNGAHMLGYSSGYIAGEQAATDVAVKTLERELEKTHRVLRFPAGGIGPHDPVKAVDTRDVFICKGEVWSDLAALIKNLDEQWPRSSIIISYADEHTATYWNAALANGTAHVKS